MTKIEEIEELRDEWERRAEAASDKEETDRYAEAHNVMYGIGLALRILKS